ncbi:MAG: glycosyltransferase family 2 protein [Intestinimonas sp.]
MNEPLVSIIVPVYNVESYLSPCLESIQRQSWRNLEVLMVDDGSTDGSSAVCADMAVADPRFRLLRQENAGVSAARNAALTLAGGSISSSWTGTTASIPRPRRPWSTPPRPWGRTWSSPIFTGWTGAAGRPGPYQGERLLTRQEFAREMVKAPANYYYGVLWNKLYRRSIVESRGLRFEREVAWGRTSSST